MKISRFFTEKKGLGLSALLGLAFFVSGTDTLAFSVPTVDLNGMSDIQTVVDKEANVYLGHPSSVLLEDGKTVYCVYPKGHGRGPLILKKSVDEGKTWSDRLPVPESWATSKETPHIYRVIDKDGKKRLIVWSALYPARFAISEDDGATWSELKAAGNWGGIVACGSQIAMKDAGHYMAFFHDDGRFIAEKSNVQNPVVFTVYTTESFDGGLSWSEPRGIYSSSEMHLCEPGAFWSPDGKQIALMLRENSRRVNSQIMFSGDNGKSWTNPRPLPDELNGDRHTPVYAQDGRLYVSFRDMQPSGKYSATSGDWCGWVGTWGDLMNGRTGEYRIRLKDNFDAFDCAYPAVNLLSNGDFLSITYGHWEKGQKPYILAERFNLEMLDKMSADMKANEAPHSAEADLEQLHKMLRNKGKPMNWVFTGDSITHAMVHTLGDRSYTEHFEERLRGEYWRVRDICVRTGISGDTADGILRDFDRRVAEYKPSVVSVMIGMNDARRGAGEKENFIKNLTCLVQKIRSIGAIPVLNNMNMIQLDKVPIQKETENFSHLVNQVAKDQGVILVDNWSWWEQNCSDPVVLDTWLNDPIHPNALGHRHFAIQLFKALNMYDPKSYTCQPYDSRREKLKKN